MPSQLEKALLNHLCTNILLYTFCTGVTALCWDNTIQGYMEYSLRRSEGQLCFQKYQQDKEFQQRSVLDSSAQYYKYCL